MIITFPLFCLSRSTQRLISRTLETCWNRCSGAIQHDHYHEAALTIQQQNFENMLKSLFQGDPGSWQEHVGILQTLQNDNKNNTIVPHDPMNKS